MSSRNRSATLALVPLLFGVLAGTDAVAQAPQGVAQKPPAANAHQHRRGPKQLVLVGSEGAEITLWKPDLSTLPLQSKMGTVTIPTTGVDNYHAVVARKDWGDTVESVIRYLYMHGKPSGQSPTRLTGVLKSELEIVPDPIPREHFRYYSDQEWGFLVRFGGKPLANVPVVMETANGSRVEGVTDTGGRVRLHIPDDFPDVVEGERDRRAAELSVSAEHVARGITYQSMLSAEYRVNQGHWRSFELGLAVAGIGMIAGGFIGRKRGGN
ncbi:MAG: hypothetical protein ABW066_01350 [Sedimenticola sp.]